MATTLNADPRSAIRTRRGTPGRGLALALAILVHLAFIAVLIFSIRWRNQAPEAVTAELYAPTPVPQKAAPQPPPAPPEPAPAPTPTPPPQMQALPAPAPAARVAPAPQVPDAREAEIALKAEAARKERVEAQRRAQAEEQKRIAELTRQREQRQQQEAQKRADEKKAAEARDRQQRMMAQLREQAVKESDARAAAEANAQKQADARKSAETDWVRRIQAKVRGNVILPPDLAGNPEAVFNVVQLPSGEIIDAKLVKSSGVKSYDDAVQRAIIKSSPLPKPDRPEMFQRELRLQFRPND
ncbi:MAG TPA: TonB C-terminal domain-containing protein [Casimicrobiaceae bacterium]|nr:TonB C-terminal domain-containing protein [Casimicrobiaceae bacterium]